METVLQAVLDEVPTDFSAIDPWEREKEPHVREILERSAGVVFHRQDLHRDEMLWFRNECRPPVRAGKRTGAGEQRVGRRRIDVDEIDPPERRIRVEVVRISGRSMKCRVTVRFEERDDVVLRPRFHDEIEIESRPGESVGREGQGADQGVPVAPFLEKNRNRCELSLEIDRVPLQKLSSARSRLVRRPREGPECSCYGPEQSVPQGTRLTTSGADEGNTTVPSECGPFEPLTQIV